MGKRKAKEIKVRKLTEFDYIVDYNTIYTERKKSLISRDPLAKDLLKKLHDYRPNKNSPSKKEIEFIRQKLADKWHVNILITGAAMPFVTDLPVIANQTCDNCLSPVKFSYDNITIEEMEPLIISNSIDGNPIRSFRPPINGILSESKTNELILHVNLSVLDNADAREIKKAVWAIIKNYIPKNKHNNQTCDIHEISFIYNIKQETFEKYIHWHDWHIKDCLGFRTIAFLEKEIKKNGHVDVNSLLKKLISMRVPLGSKESYPGEDRVEKGVKLIYEAIHRKKYARKDRHELLDNYLCPDHPDNNKCPSTCEYRKQWESRFNAVMPVLKAGYNIPLKNDTAKDGDDND